MVKKTAIYIRVSVLKEEAVSPEMQLDKGKQYCDLHDEKYQVFEDLNFSGKDTNRPAFQEMTGEIKAGLISKVVVYRLDRLSRSIKDLALFMDLLRENGVEFYSITERFDTTTPMGRAMLNIMGVFSQMEREVISQRIKDTKAKQMADGLKLGMPPFGYRLEVGNHGTWKIISEEARIVKKAFELYSTGRWSYKSIAFYLNGGFPRQRKRINGQSTWGYGEYSNRTWQPWTVRCIIRNPVYAGLVNEGNNNQAKNLKGVIPYQVFKCCQEIREKRTSTSRQYNHSTTKDHPLKGKIFCSCGFRMYGVRNYSSKDQNGKLYYWCRNITHPGKRPYVLATMIFRDNLFLPLIPTSAVGVAKYL